MNERSVIFLPSLSLTLDEPWGRNGCKALPDNLQNIFNGSREKRESLALGDRATISTHRQEIYPSHCRRSQHVPSQMEI